MTTTTRNNSGRYSALEAGHDVDIQRVRFGQWAGWWTLFVDGEDCGWYFRTKTAAVAEIPRYVNGYIRVCMAR